MGSGRSPTEPRQWISALGAVPAIIALSLGVLYTTGAVVVYGQVSNAGQRPLDYIPLVPLEQLLGKGIAAMLPSALVGLVIGVVIAAVLPRPGSGARSQPVREPAVVVRDVFRDWRGWVAAVGIVVGVLATPWSDAVSFIVGMAVGGLVIKFAFQSVAQRFPGNAYTMSWTLIITIAVFVSTISNSLIDPRPLPTASVELSDGEFLGGEVVLSTDSTLYVKPEDEVLAVEAAKIDRTTIRRPDESDPESLANWLLPG